MLRVSIDCLHFNTVARNGCEFTILNYSGVVTIDKNYLD